MDNIIKNYSVIVFDVGGTLMEYSGMPLSWVNYYPKGFKFVSEKFHLNLSDDAIEKSVAVMTEFNPRINYRESEIPPEEIFTEATKHWNTVVELNEIIATFFKGLSLKATIFDYSLPVIDFFKNKGLAVGLLTDLPCGMPDELFKAQIDTLVNSCDFYISSQSCGYRKPNPRGIQIASNICAVTTDKIIMIGDEEKDRLTAKNACCGFMNVENFRTILQDKKYLK